jgi:cell division protein FtsI (penicillin-binding protein 3)
MTERRTKARFITGTVFMFLAMQGLGVRLAFLHLGDHERARVRTEVLRRSRRELLAGRGRIYDCSGNRNLLALNLAVRDVCASPSDVLTNNCMEEVVTGLSPLLNLPADALKARIMGRKHADHCYLRRFVPEEECRRVEEARLPHVFFEEGIVRHYPLGSLLCHVLGFVNHDGFGSAGIEWKADSYLRACPGLEESRRDALNRELYWPEGRHIPAIQGADITLTIDQNIQFVVEQALDALMAEHRPAGAWAVVQRVRTGEILAMASRPDYDPNLFNTTAASNRINRAISHVYEPGSTFKLVTIAAALNEGTVTPRTVFDCEQGRWHFAGRDLNDTHPYAMLTVEQGVQKSSNILAAKVALQLGRKRFYRYLRDFGIGEKLGVDLPGEARGLLSPPQRWCELQFSRIGIGQGVSVTALQMLGACCAIANDGYLMRPYVIREIRDPDGTVLLRRSPEVLRKCVSYETAKTMRRLLCGVTENGGTGRRARVEGYDVAGKTGTAQKSMGKEGYSKTDYMASFVGFLPAGQPEIGIIVVADTPQPVHSGGRVAAPAFSRIGEQVARYLDLLPDASGSVARR